MRVFISAGEASGENYGAMLIPALRGVFGKDTEFVGVGGERMRDAGCEIIVDSKSVAVIGITEVLKHIPHIYREFYRTVGTLKRQRPDIAVLIDFPDFNLRLAQQLHRIGVPVVYFVSPQLWAWKKRRIRRVRRFVDRMLVIFPFEEQYYRERGVQAEYVGHPLADLLLPSRSRAGLAAEEHLDPQKHWIALLPGSRRKEVILNLPIMLQAAAELGEGYQYLLPVASTLSPEWVEQQLRSCRVKIFLMKDARQALFHARASIVASGTATVEAALMGNPFVVVYRVSWLSYEIGRRFVKLDHYAMVNLIAGREIVPELIQGRFTARNVVSEMQKLLMDGPTRDTMIQDLRVVRDKLHLSPTASGSTAIDRAAAAVADLMR